MEYEIMNFKKLDNTGTLCAIADITVGKSVTICSAKVVRKKEDNSLFLALPTRKADDKYLPEVLIIDKELRDRISNDMIQRTVTALG